MSLTIHLAAPGWLAIQLHEDFDLVDAMALHTAIVGLEPRQRATVDFHEARRCAPAALARLALDVQQTPGDVVLTGMGWYERRLLTYFGVPDSNVRASDEGP